VLDIHKDGLEISKTELERRDGRRPIVTATAGARPSLPNSAAVVALIPPRRACLRLRRTLSRSVASCEAHTKRFGIVQLPEKAHYAYCQQIVMLAHHAIWHSTNRDST